MNDQGVWKRLLARVDVSNTHRLSEVVSWQYTKN
jgi:hypothetical protein